MSANVHALKKDSTHVVKGNSFVLIPSSQTDQDFYTKVRDLFGIANTRLADVSGNRSVRSGSSAYSRRVFNFGRDQLTHVEANGFRHAMPMVDMQRAVIRAKPMTFSLSVPEDTAAIMHLANINGVALENNIAVAELYRLVAPNLEEIRALCRCMHFDDKLIAIIERMPVFSTTTDAGTGLSLDVVIITTIDASLMQHHESVLESFTNVMISRKAPWLAPAHLNDRTGVPMETTTLTGINYERSTVSNCVLVYHDVGYTQRYTHDCGVVVEISQVQDPSREEGFYKEWHTFDETGRFHIRKQFIPRSKVCHTVGFFVRAYEANLYKPSHEIEEIYTGLRKQLEAIAKDITQQLNQTFERILADNTATKKTVDRITQESEARADARIGKMQEEIDRLKKENVKHEREKDDLRHEMREAKSFKKETADVLKVVGASIGLVAVILTQFKPKKKGTTTSM